MKYVVGYDKDKTFVVLYETNNVRLALLMAKKYREAGKEDVKTKKRGLTGLPMYDII